MNNRRANQFEIYGNIEKSGDEFIGFIIVMTKYEHTLKDRKYWFKYRSRHYCEPTEEKYWIDQGYVINNSDYCLKKIIKDVCEDMYDLNKDGMIHNDIKPDNIVWDQYKHKWSLIDFDLMTEDANEPRPARGCRGTLFYWAPEMRKPISNHKYQSLFTKEGDMWQLAMTICYIIFRGCHVGKFVTKICEHLKFLKDSGDKFHYKHTITNPIYQQLLFETLKSSDDVSSDILDMMKMMMVIDYRQRADAKSVLNKFF